MPNYIRMAADQTVEAVCLTDETRIETQFGPVKGQKGDWIVRDYLGRLSLFSTAEFIQKFDADTLDPSSTTYLNQWRYYPGPVITQIEPSSGLVGSTVYIAGDKFKNTQGTSKVYFGLAHLIEATVTAWSNTLITITVPAGVSTEHPTEIRVVVGGVSSNRVTFEVTVPGP